MYRVIAGCGGKRGAQNGMYRFVKWPKIGNQTGLTPVKIPTTSATTAVSQSSRGWEAETHGVRRHKWLIKGAEHANTMSHCARQEVGHRRSGSVKGSGFCIVFEISHWSPPIQVFFHGFFSSDR
jgi:hypothetical protein